ncbi:hypothetical protein CORC01_04809 [Colletotrichum orchidophilum]|uniref:Major facilitator superfamily (MFS) profile domain-containing protein n=1 Tax=Colletotrichum orchidophilum TaxID=1209926 RepID=A0A1G4BEV0_9PEZI|nr:uncharacterized protein CORC01_04809 [Colletotrichum orchidophilum]OHE99908.1 hypothetical protein CORC01_04809 [Colletotrichum orchidophilum]
MRFHIIILALAGLVIGTPVDLLERSAPADVQNISNEEMRDRLLRTHTPHLIHQSWSLNDFEGLVMPHAGTEATIYLRDLGAFVPLTSFRNAPGSEGETTKFTPHCYSWDLWELRDLKTYWSEYSAASKIEYVGQIEDPGPVGIDWHRSIPVKRRLSLTPDWKPIREMLSTSLGIAITDNWIGKGTFECTTLPDRRIRLWFQKYFGAAMLWKKTCTICYGSRFKCDDEWTPQGQVIVPSDGSDPAINYNMHYTASSSLSAASMERQHQGFELETMSLPNRTSTLSSATGHQETAEEIEQASLPPADRGREAWLVLLGCILIQIPVWGYSLAFGVFQEYYGSHPDKLEGESSNVAVIGTTMTGLMYLISPFTFTILSRWPRLRRWFGPLGLVLTAAGFLLSSFARTVGQLIATQGVICALGCGLLFTPTTLYLDEWFVKRKGLAYGVMWAGKSAAGVGLPFAMETCLQRFGPVITLRAWSIATILISAPLLYFLKPRIPLAQSAAVRRINLNFIHLPSFWMLQIGNVLQSLGYFLPYTYLSTYAVQQLHVSTTVATTLLVLVNVTSIPGGIVMGSLGDHVRVSTVILISTVGSALAVFLFWGFSSQTALLAVFSITYGFFAGGFSSTWSAVLSELKAESPAVDTGFIFGLLAGGRGIGNVISGPLSVALLAGDGLIRDDPPKLGSTGRWRWPSAE